MIQEALALITFNQSRAASNPGIGRRTLIVSDEPEHGSTRPSAVSIIRRAWRRMRRR